MTNLRPRPPRSHRRRQLLGWALDLSLILIVVLAIILVMWRYPA
jgi:hypothetical protein